MKTLFFYIALIILAFNFTCCKAKHAADTTSLKTDMKSENVRLLVSFISKGAGLDQESATAFNAYVSYHTKKPVYTIYHWGREGETDYCFQLTELSKKEQEVFVTEIKKRVKLDDMVFVKENVEYHPKQR